jgi:hypothetical protein
MPIIFVYRNAKPGWPQRSEKASKHRGFCMREKNGGHIVWPPFLVEKRSRDDMAISARIILEGNPI